MEPVSRYYFSQRLKLRYLVWGDESRPPLLLVHGTRDHARHLTVEGVRGGEGGGFTWKFDNFTHAGSPYEFNMEDARDLWNQIRCPILVISGEESWGAHNVKPDLSAFHDCRYEKVPKAGHWVHHDQFEVFMSLVNGFLSE